MRRYDPLARKSDPSPSRSVRSGRDGRPDGKPRSSPGRSSQRDRVSPGRGSQRDKRTPSPKSPRRQSPAGPADRACWEYTKTGKCQYGRECRFEHDKSPRNPAAPSTPRTGDRPVTHTPDRIQKMDVTKLHPKIGATWMHALWNLMLLEWACAHWFVRSNMILALLAVCLQPPRNTCVLMFPTQRTQPQFGL